MMHKKAKETSSNGAPVSAIPSSGGVDSRTAGASASASVARNGPLGVH